MINLMGLSLDASRLKEKVRMEKESIKNMV